MLILVNYCLLKLGGREMGLWVSQKIILMHQVRVSVLAFMKYIYEHVTSCGSGLFGFLCDGK